MQTPMTTQQCSDYIGQLKALHRQGHAIQEQVREQHGDNAVSVIGEIMELQETEIGAGSAARDLLLSCDEIIEDIAKASE